MLTTQYPIFEQNIKNAFYQGLVNAFLSISSTEGIDSNISPIIQQKMKQSAEIFAKAFTDTAVNSIVSEIDKYIKSIGVTINYTPVGLVSPAGPVTGILTIPPSAITIN